MRKLEKTERSGLVNLLIRPISLILSLIYTPLLLNYLGDEKYGLWSTVLSIISWVNYFDVGIGNGLRNVIPELYIKKEYSNLKKCISTAYILISGISFCLFVVVIIVLQIIDWKSLFDTKIDMKIVVGISFAFICVNFVLSLCDTILYSLQYAERVSFKGLFSQILNILGIIGLTRLTEANLVLVALLFGSTQFLANIINSYLLMNNHNYLTPSIMEFDFKYIKNICNIGIRFFIIQIMCLVMFTTDKLIVTHFWGGAENTKFSIVDSVYNTGFSLFAAFMVPYWSRATVAYIEKDGNWIVKSLKKALIVMSIFISGYFVMIVLFRPVVYVWLKKEYNYPQSLIVIMAIFYALYSVLHLECQFINGTGKITVQLIMYVICGVINIPLSLLIGKSMGMGPAGVRLATLILVMIIDIVLFLNLRKIIIKIATISDY